MSRQARRFAMGGSFKYLWLLTQATLTISVGASRNWTKSKGTLLTSTPLDSSVCGVEGVKQRSGYFSIEDESSTDKNYFYWFFESQDQPSEDPVVLWLTGGPGCSSTLALLAENGPCTVNDDGESTTPNPFSWNLRANMLWVDQPAGVGFSYGEGAGDYDHGEDEVSEDMYWFLQAFFNGHPEFAHNDFYIFGESYGGHYAPAVAYRVWQGNRMGVQNVINMRGLSVGNGLTAPEIQYPFYPEMAINNPYGVKALTQEEADLMQAYTPACIELIHGCQTRAEMCTDARTFCDVHLTVPYEVSGLNPYDVRLPCGEAELCYDFSKIENFLRLDSTRQALNVREESAAWQSCNMKVNRDFTSDWMRNFDSYIGPMLDSDIKVLIYAGDADFICNYMGNEAWTLNLDWTGKEGFKAAKPVEWTPRDGLSPAGLSRSYGGLTFLRVYEAGHMVPMDQPQAAVAMLNAFVHEKSAPFMAPPELFDTESERAKAV